MPHRLTTVVSLAALIMNVSLLRADTPPATAPSTSPTTAPAVQAKPLSDQVKKGLAWLIEHQQSDGGWNQGEASASLGRSGEHIDQSNVADTCMAALALLRAGNTPAQGEYAQNTLRAVDFVCGQVEHASKEGLFVTDVKGTRVQTKLGQYIDTFSAALLLAEVRGAMPDDAGRTRVAAALDKVIAKIQANQKEDGRWVDAHDGWASALCQSVAHKALNRAAQNGADVSSTVLQKASDYANSNFDSKTEQVRAAGSANVELYARSSNLGALKDSDDTNKQVEEKLRFEVASSATQPEAREHAVQQLRAIESNRDNMQQAQAAIVAKLDDKQFVAGFGSNGGEEFLSHMNIGEAMVAKGGDGWVKWDKSMTENLDRIQNADGSWSGQHCITGRTFCTSTALMVLMTDRATRAMAAEIKQK